MFNALPVLCLDCAGPGLAVTAGAGIKVPLASRPEVVAGLAQGIRWAAQNGPYTEKQVTYILERKPHPQQGFRSCLGILRLGKQYSKERLEAACAYALTIHGYFYKSVESILKNGLDQKHTLLHPREELTLPLTHLNIRGKEYYQ
jgi:transposase